MEQNNKGNLASRIISYILVAILASGITAFFISPPNTEQPQSVQEQKLKELEKLIGDCFIGEGELTAMYDGAAAGMISGLGDRWSYYIPASEYQSYQEQMQNAYVGIGVTISTQEEDLFTVLQVEPSGGAQEAGILPGDVIVAVEGQRISEIGYDAASELIRGEVGTQLSVTVDRNGSELTVTVTRKLIKVQVAKGVMLEDNIGLITIKNFDDRCAEETIAAIEALREQGAKALIFDVRFNPGGYKHELVKLLDYLLPEGKLFQSQNYTGHETVDKSDAKCLEMPMAVLVNGDSYSAAEFFAAALREYNWGFVVGEPTVGKGYFQSTFELCDGSAVSLSIGKYFTPNGVSLAEVGGLVPEVVVEVDMETAAKIYSQLIEPADDPQIQAAVAALKEKMP